MANGQISKLLKCLLVVPTGSVTVERLAAFARESGTVTGHNQFIDLVGLVGEQRNRALVGRILVNRRSESR